MSLFKVHKGASQNLPTTLTEGYCWYTYNDSKFYIDFKDENGVLTRKALNANEASKLIGYDISTILNSSDVEIPTSKAVLDAINAIEIDSSNKAAVVLAEAQKGIDLERERAEHAEEALSNRIDALDIGDSTHTHSWNDLEDKPFGEETDGTIRELDEKYVPNSIARVSDVQDIIANLPQTGQPKIATITLLAANWMGDTNPWSQVVTINGATINSKLDLQPTATQIVSLQNDEIMLMLENNDGEVTAWAIGNKPTEDYTMQVLITEVTPV